MAMPRTPRAKAAVSGQAAKNPQRFKSRKEPQAPPLGNPPSWMSKEQKAVWAQFALELPWLNGSHRALLEIAVNVRTRLIAGQDVGVQAMNLLRQCLGQMGATPADATKVVLPDGEESDPDEAFFARPN